MKRGIIIASGALLLLLDRITKAWAFSVLRAAPDMTLQVIPGVVSFSYAENTGAAFGILSGMQLLNGLLTLALLIALAVFLYRSRNMRGVAVSGAVVMAGGLSHLYDRLLGRNIIDFIRLDFINFPIFNFADICICIGTAMLAIAYIRADNSTRSEEK